MIKRLAHICFRTNRYAELVGFYRDRLGLPVKFTFDGRDGVEFGCYLDLGGTTFIEIFDRAGAARQWGGGARATDAAGSGAETGAAPAPEVGYGHFCLQVEGLEAFCAALRAKGVNVGEVRGGMDGSRQAWLKDSDGNAIELMEYTAGSLQLAVGVGVAREA